MTHDFDEFVRETFEANIKYGIYLPPNGKPVFDFFIDVTTGAFLEWTVMIPSVESLIKKQRRPGDDIIETIDSVRFSFLTSLILSGRHPVLITGSSGVGKSLIMHNMLKRLSEGGFSYKSSSVLGEIFNYADKVKQLTANSSISMLSEEMESGNKKNNKEEIGWH